MMSAEIAVDEVFVPHLGWLSHAPGDEVARLLDEGWFEYREQAFLWLYLQGTATVIDCGAHIGLFSVLGGRLVGSEGRVVAVEPHPQTSWFLQQNLKAHCLANSSVVTSAVGAHHGVAVFNLGSTARAAYSSLLSIDESSKRLEVAIVTLEALTASRQIQDIDLLKIDVEGYEIKALAGAARLLAAGRAKVLIVEFAEQNLNRGGHTTADLRDAITAAGYALYRFHDHDLELKPASITAPIAYENLFAVKGPVSLVNAHLAQSGHDRRRVATQIIRRGRACEKLRTARASVGVLRTQLDQTAQTLSRQEARVREQEQHIASLQMTCDAAARENARLRRDYHRVTSSRSWRYTRWLRRLTRVAATLTRGAVRVIALSRGVLGSRGIHSK